MKTQPPRILIPSDWNGEDWECFQITWPNSPEWIAVLRGLITLPMRARNWDERSGSLFAVQQIGYQIEAANIPLTTCEGEQVPGSDDEPEAEIRFIFAESEETLDMGWLCGVNPDAFRIVDGVLEVRNFCGEWVEIGELRPPTDTSPDDIWDGIDPPPDFYGCGKVSSLIDYMVALSSALWSHYDDPSTIEAAARAAVPPATLSRARIYQWVASLILLDQAGFDQSDFENIEAIQTAKCYAAASAENTPEGTESEKEAVEEAMASAFYQIVGIQPKENWRAYWHAIQETIGDQDCRLLLTLGATDADANCDCPAEPNVATDPDANGWYWSAEFVGTVECTGDYNTILCVAHVLEHDAFGYRFRLLRDDDSKNYKRMGFASTGCTPGDEAWGNTSDHLEYADQDFYWASGNETLLQTLFSAVGLVQDTDWGLQSSNYGTSDDPNTPGKVQGTVMSHGFFGDDMTTGDSYTVQMRLLMNINSPSHS